MARRKLETLSEQMYYVLLSLHTEPMHGYRIMQYVNDLTQGRVVIGAGTLYALLARFEEGRKSYDLTDVGQKTLENEFDRLRQQVSDGAKQLKKGDMK